MSSLDELIKAFETGLIKEVKPTQIEYRFHYDEYGKIYLCTSNDHPENTNYLVVTKEEFDEYFKYYVVDGRLTEKPGDLSFYPPLEKTIYTKKSVNKHAAILK